MLFKISAHWAGNMSPAQQNECFNITVLKGINHLFMLALRQRKVASLVETTGADRVRAMSLQLDRFD